MSRRPRRCPAGTCFHVLNRAAARWPLFEKLEDDESFERVLVEAHLQITLPILPYCLMPNHWHFVVRPTADDELSEFFRSLTHTHVMRARSLPHGGDRTSLPGADLRRFPLKMTITCTPYCVTWNAIRSGRISANASKTGNSAAPGE